MLLFRRKYPAVRLIRCGKTAGSQRGRPQGVIDLDVSSHSTRGRDPRELGLSATAVSCAVLFHVSAQRGGPLGMSRIARDLEPYVIHRLSPAAWRRCLAQTLSHLAEDGSIELTGCNVLPAEPIWRRRDGLAGCHIARDASWGELRDIHLAACALGLSGEARRRRALLTSVGLRSAILEKAFDVRLRDGKGYASLRDALARLALRRGVVEGDAAVATGLLGPGERRRQAANLLIHAKRQPTSDGQLVAAIAAEQLGARGTSPSALRLELLRRHLTGVAFARGAVPPLPRKRFDLAEFLEEVRNFARQLAQGWQGNRRALISRVFPALSGAHPEWGLDVTRFKTLLAEAHRSGRLSLVNADLRDRNIIAELQASAVAYHNMILHFIRVEDEASDAA
jgi:hypothetical protein